ncbi:ClpP/crotonase [Fragilariopsis cylindrus CCMP1102]|uniref:ClpP/crotonase n=1 Tax=Fragilariopsis cylindrus CCMP1102 TaxID=635003 RepID=A0A1E7F011_9STRA|nr:ClpP/crotonase [Fragilariopsis cylindrus CCMP1102]|eukprot:OEU11143.1 ClpP/crotonase [Fragilariopsis cylindrus CCMP1102]
MSTSTSTSTSTTPLVSWSVDESKKIGTITLNSPKTLNALTIEMGKEFETLITKLQDDLTSTSDDDNNPNKDISAIVLCGSGDKAFSSGGDMQWLRGLKNNSVHANVDIMMNFYNSFLCIRTKNLPVPIIAAIQGPAMGAGACLALACDLRIASDTDTDADTDTDTDADADADSSTRTRTRTRPVLGFPFTKLGIPSGMGSIHLLQNVNKLSQSQVSEILLLGKSLSGEEAYKLGLINKLVPHTQNVKDEAYNMALDISTNHHPVAIRSMIRSIRLNVDENKLIDSLYKDAHAQAMCYARNDWGEGLHKAPPHFDNYHSK